MKKKLQSMLALLCISLLSQAQNPTCIYTPYVKTFTPPLTASPGGNTIQNPTFESNLLTNWTPLPNANRVKTATNGYNSNYCAKIISTTNARGDAFMTETITNLIPGNTYSISAWLKSNLAVNNKVKSIDLKVRFNYPNGSNQVISKSFFPTTTWTKYTNTFTVPNNVNLQQTIVQISMYRGQQDSMYVDDVELITPPTTFGFLSQEFPAPPVGELIENFEDSTGNTLSNSKWLVVKKEWGNGNVAYNNGVVPENLELLCDGGMRFHGHGDLYNGPINGVANILGNGKVRVGACIATKDYYASGRYEVVAKVTPGMINAFWTFHYIEDPNFQNGGMKNSEIDWEFPSNLYTGNKHTITDGLCNTWGGLCDGVGLTTSGISYKENLNVVDASQDFHTYTIEWHTGDSNIAPSISWYFDSVLVRQETNPTYIPFRASRFWIGVWYGNTNWITGGDMSVLQYADKYMDVRSV
jgi:hypothetical protein